VTLGYAYLHGYGSSPTSKKGMLLREVFTRHGQVLHLPDLNRPSSTNVTLGGQLLAVDELARAHPEITRWSFIGSSMGGWTAARWASLHPRRMHHLLLLCPGFELLTRWRTLVEDGDAHPAVPSVPCPTVIVHGKHDVTVPIAVSRRYAEAHPGHVRLVEVDDDHLLMKSTALIEQLAVEHLL